MKAPEAERPPDLIRVLGDVRDELRMREPLPPGEMGFSLRRTHSFQRNTLEMLLDYYERSASS